MEKFMKEIIAFTEDDVNKLNIGCLPSEGRYFYQRCEKIKDGAFRAKVYVPKGELYYHFFEPTEPQKIYLDVENLQEGAKSWHSIMIIGTSAFLPFTYKLEESYINKISSENYEVKAMINYKWADNVELCLESKGKEHSVNMEEIFEFKGRKYLKAIISEDEIINSKFYFKIYGNDNELYYYGANKKIMKEIPEKFIITDKKIKKMQMEYNNFNDQGVIYHIFPDSFYRGSSFKEQNGIIYNDIDSDAKGDEYYGGTIEGIKEKIEYLCMLGIKTIYLTPIYSANSPHRYNSINYTEIDKLLGNNQEFDNLVKECHKNGMKIILDIILNHCGTDFFAFKDVLKNQENSKYKDWFIINKYPVNVNSNEIMYSCWWNNKSMPQFNLDNEDVKKYLFESCAFWVEKYHIDGWRIDVSSELGLELINEFCEEMRNINKDIIIVGENWKKSQKYLGPSGFNGITNYLLWWKAYVPFFIDKSMDVKEFANEIFECYFSYSHLAYCQCWNLISSHDLPRFKNRLKNDKDFELLVLIQMLLPGSPIIYYGDEIGMNQGDDPKNRKYMEWGKCGNNPIYDFYRKLIHIRNSKEVLKTGLLKVKYYTEYPNVISFTRYNDKESVIIIINFGDSEVNINRNAICQENTDYNDIWTNEVIDSPNVFLESKDFKVLSEGRN